MIKIKQRDNWIIIEGKGFFPREALEFRQVDGRIRIFDTWNNKRLTEDMRPEMLLGEDGKQFLAEEDTIEEAIIAKLPEPASAVRVFNLWAEENGDLRDNSSQWSHGNGAAKTNNAMVILRDGHLAAMGLNVDTAPQSTCVVLILINDKVGGYVVLEAGQRHVVHVFDRPVAVKKGDRARFYTYLGGKAKIGTVNAEITE